MYINSQRSSAIPRKNTKQANKKPIRRNLTVKLLKIKNKGQTIKTQSKKKRHYIQNKNDTNFSPETMPAKDNRMAPLRN